MRSIKRLMAVLVTALLLSTGASFAGSDLNEVGAMLVYPAIVALDNNAPFTFESYATITNASASPVVAHVSMINGDRDDNEYCYECDFDVPLSGNDTEMLIIRWDAVGGVVIETEPDGQFGFNAIQHSCPMEFGMLVVTIEDGAGNTLTDNVLLGEQVVVEYDQGYAFSIPAIPFQGGDGGDGDRALELDDNEYGKLPRVVAADFIAPDLNSNPLNAQLVLFTLNFVRQLPPATDCSVTGYDADENPFSRSIQFGCWDWFDLYDISTEFAYPNLGLSALANDTHGWLQLNCTSQPDARIPTGPVSAGTVHGAIIQRAMDGSIVRRNDPAAPALTNAAAWGRLLYQSVTTGDAVTLTLEGVAPGLN